jgi:galactose mutarotase-like enzyme
MKYTLKRGTLTAQIVSLGAELISLVKDGRDYIWCGDAAYWNGHNPTLFPVIGFLKDNMTCFDGVKYQIPKHGYARKTEFELVEQTDNSITLRMTDSETTRSGYPFRFVFDITHRLTEDGFETEYTISNCDDRSMPFMIGAHTGFALPFTDGQRFEDHTLIFECPESYVTRYIAVNGQYIEDSMGETDFLDGTDRIALDYRLFDDDALMLAGLKSRKVALLDQNGRGVGMEFNGFDALGIWTPPGKNAPFLCLEPWNGINAFMDEAPEFSQKPFIRTLDAGERYSVSYSVSIFD